MKRASLIAFIFALVVSAGAFAGILSRNGSSAVIVDTGTPASYGTETVGAALEQLANEDPNTTLFCDFECTGAQGACDAKAATVTNWLSYSDDLEFAYTAGNYGWLPNQNDTTLTKSVGAGVGGRNAYTITTTALNGGFYYLDRRAFDSGVYALSFDVKAGTSSTFTSIFNVASGSWSSPLYSAAKVISGPGAASVNAGTATITGLSASEWTRVLLYGVPFVNEDDFQFGLLPPNGQSIVVSGGFTLERGTFLGSYCGPTTTGELPCPTTATATAQARCGISGHTHQGVGPFTDANYFTNADTLAVPYLYACGLVNPTDLSNAPVLLTTGTAVTDGLDLRIAADGSACITTNDLGQTASSCTAAGQVLINTTNLICWGVWTNTLVTLGIVKVNGNAAVSNAVGMPAVPLGTQTFLGRGRDAGHEFRGIVYEFDAREGYATGGMFDAVWTAVSACRTAGTCLRDYLRSADGESTRLTELDGEEYQIGGNWCGQTPCTASSRFDLQGQVLTRQGRYNFPAVAWKNIGTVNLSQAGEPPHPKGYGGKRWWLRGFQAGANELNYDAALDASTFTFCHDFTQTDERASGNDAGVGLDTPFSATNGSSEGWRITSSLSQPLPGQATGAYWSRMGTISFRWFDLSGVEHEIESEPVSLAQDRRVCVGHDGTSGWLALNGIAPKSAAYTYQPWSAGSATYGGKDATTAFPSDFAELMLTTTKPTASLLKYLTHAACTAGDSADCIPKVANEVLRCNARDYDTGTKIMPCKVNAPGGTWSNAGTLTKISRASAPEPDVRAAVGAKPYIGGAVQLGAGSDVLDYTGDFTCSIVFADPRLGTHTNSNIISNGGEGVGGWWVNTIAGPAVRVTFAKQGSADKPIDTTAASVVDGTNIVSWGRAGTTGWVKANMTTSVSGDAGTAAAGTLYTAELGSHSGFSPWYSAFYQLWCSSSTPTAAKLDSAHARYYGVLGARSRALSTTRTADGTYTAAARLSGLPANVMRTMPPAAVHFSPTTLYSRHQTSAAGRFIGARNNNNAFTSAGGGVDTSRWSFDGMTFTENAAVAPDGSMTATTVRETAAYGLHRMQGDMGRGGGCGNWAEARSIYIRPVGNGGLPDQTLLYYSWVGGVYNQVAHYGSGATAGYSTNIAESVVGGHEHLADGWIRMFFSSTCPNGLLTYIENREGRTGQQSYYGDRTRGFDLWGMQQQYYNEGAYARTLTPYCGHATVSQIFCNGEVETLDNPLRPLGTDVSNAVAYSEALTNSPWQSAGVTIAPASYLAPDQSLTMDKLTSANATAVRQQVVARTDAAYTASAYVRADSGTFDMTVGATCGQAGGVAATNCTCGRDDGGACTAFTSVGFECYASATVGTSPVRLWATNTCASAVTDGFVRIMAGKLGTSFGSGGVWGAQFVPGSVPLNYCPTGATARTCGPGGVTGKVSSNWLLQSSTLAHASWLKEDAGVVATDNSASCPLDPTDQAGVRRMSLVTFVNDGKGIYQDTGATATPYRRAYFATATGDANCVLGASAAAVGGGGPTDMALTSTPTAFYTYGGWNASSRGAYFFRSASAGECARACISGVQANPDGGAFCGDTGAATKTCSAPQQRWCVRAKDATPYMGRWWNGWPGTNASVGNPTRENYLWAFGTNSAANSARFTDSYDASLWFTVYDAAGTAHTLQYTHGFAAGSTHTLVTCVLDGVMSLTVDGTTVTPTATSGQGGALLAYFNPTFYWGVAANSLNQWNGTMDTLDFNLTGDPKDFAP